MQNVLYIHDFLFIWFFLAGLPDKHFPFNLVWKNAEPCFYAKYDNNNLITRYCWRPQTMRQLDTRSRAGAVAGRGTEWTERWLADGDRALTAAMPWHRKRKCCCHHIDMTTNALRSSWDCSKWHSIYLPPATFHLPPYPYIAGLLTGKCN